MKYFTLLSLVVVSLLFTACGEKTKKAASEATDKVTEAVKADTSSAVESAKQAASDAAEATKAKAAEVAKAAKAKAEEVAAEAKAEAAKVAAKAAEQAEQAKVKAAKAAEALKQRAAAATETKAPVEPAAYAKCKGCHGADGKTKALGKSAILAGQEKAALIAAIKGYQAGTRNVAGMGMLMKGQVAGLSDADIEAVAEYLSKK
jgi:cytochrome c553